MKNSFMWKRGDGGNRRKSGNMGRKEIKSEGKGEERGEQNAGKGKDLKVQIQIPLKLEVDSEEKRGKKMEKTTEEMT